MKKITYLYVAPQIVGTLEKWEYSYNTSLARFKKKETANKQGMRDLEHDDFWVVELHDGIAVAIYQAGELEKRKNCKTELKGINAELGN